MKVPICTKPQSAIPRTARWLAAGLLIVLFAIPSLAVAQGGAGCAGAIDVSNDGSNFAGIASFSDYYYVDRPDSIVWTLNPKAGGDLTVTTDQVQFALTCANNGDAIPCANFNDEQANNPGVTPVVYANRVGDPTGTCGATLASNALGVLTFDLPNTDLDSTGCTIEFATDLEDIGGGGASLDTTPKLITAAVGFSGTCADGGLEGNAAGSIAVEVWDPEIDVTKKGPTLAKVGDEIEYEIGCTVVTDPEAIDICTGNDPLLGGDLGVFDCVAGQTRKFNYTIKVGDPNPLKNTATITCSLKDSANTVSDNDNWEVPTIAPAIAATKTGPKLAKAGDEITYTIGFTATNDGQYLGVCTGNDPLLGGDLGVFVAGVTRDFLYTVKVGDPNPLQNEVTITCDITDRTNKASGKANWDVTLFKIGATLTKTCDPKSIAVPNDINWEICVENTGDKALDCLIDDDKVPYAGELVQVPVGTTPVCLNASRATTSADVPSITNVASGSCTVAASEGQYDNKVTLPDADATCEVNDVKEYCRTPGFWKTHAGVEKAGRSTNLTQTVIDVYGTLGTICGVDITDTTTYNYVGTGWGTSNGYESAVEGMCVHPKQKIVRQLQRQLIAAAINCVVSGGSADCTGLLVGDNWKAANASCLAEDGEMSSWVDEIDDFNNGRAPYTCSENIKESDVFKDLIAAGNKVPGPAGSSNACSEATGNDFYLVPLPSGPTP